MRGEAGEGWRIMTQTDLLLFLILALLFFMAYRLTGILSTLDSIYDAITDYLHSILEELKK